MTSEQALANLYNASKMANLSADAHEVLKQSAIVLQKLIIPEEKTEITVQE